MASLIGLFKSDSEELGDSEKLLDLYWNRAELKKEFAALRDEKFQLQDHIKHHEGLVAGVQQKMTHLESLLQDREWVHNVVAFYQLRRLAVYCHGKLARFAEELKQQREHRVHSKVLDSWKEKCRVEANLIERQIGEYRMQVQMLEDQLQSERHKLMTMSGIAKLFRGRKLARAIDEIVVKIETGQQQEHELLLALEKLQNLDPPNHQGLDTAAKRSINFMILSYAQQLYLHFAEDNLAVLAKEASEKSVGAVSYGDKQDCDNLVDLLEKRWESMEKVVDTPEVLQKRAQLIAENASFRDKDDVVPVPASVATIFAVDMNGAIREKDVRMLGDNYFGIEKVLSR